MQLTKFTHACVRLTEDDRTLVLDPGVYSEVDEAIDGADAILVTHEHPDHVEADKIRAALQGDSRLRLFAPNSVTGQFAQFGEQVVTVDAGQEFDAAGFTVQAFGGQHAVIHPAIPVITNLGYLVAGRVFHPGDSLTVPSAPVETLLLPTSAPWAKASEIIDYAIAVRAPHTFQVHDSLGTDAYVAVVEGHIGRLTAPHGVDFRHVGVRETVDA